MRIVSVLHFCNYTLIIMNNMESYKDLINSGKVVLVEFFATWCGHCQRMMPIVEEIKELTAGKAEIYQLDVDRNQSLCEQERITGTPTFILYSGGKEVWRHDGETDGQELLDKIQSCY